MQLDTNQILNVAIATALGIVLGSIVKGMLAKSQFGAKLGLSNFENYDDDDNF